MTSTDGAGGAPPAGVLAKPDERFERKIALSRVALAFELAWPRLWLPLGVCGVFLFACFAGLWPLLTAPQHVAALGLFAAAGLASLVPLVRLRWPSRQDGLKRLESLSGLPHRPASSYEDTLAGPPPTGPTAALWEAQRRRLRRMVASLKPQPPHPRTEPRDPFALRALLVLGLGLSAIVAGDAFPDRLASAFRLGPVVALTPTRLDAWVTPPAYTGRQPILLLDGQAAANAATETTSTTIEVPEGSVLTVRAAGPAHAGYAMQTAAPGAVPVAVPEEAKADAASPLSEFRYALTAAREVSIADSGSVRQSWQFKVIPDQAPTIALTEEPQRSSRGALLLSYRATDDYGVASAEARFALADTAEAKPLKLADGSQIDPLGEPPTLPLKFPKSASMKDVKGKSSLDLASHLWAGLKVRMTLAATDHAGHTGTADHAPFVLPEREFHNPLARALIEQRRKLAFSPGDYLDVRYALDALAIAPDKFPIDPGAYLSLRSIWRQLKETPSKEGFQSVTDQLWQLALRIESGRLNEAELALKDAEDKLAKALDEGANDAEIKRLMDQLRQALGKYLQSLAEQGQQPGGKPLPPDTQMLTSQDFEAMLKRMEQMAQSGNKDAAGQMLAELRDLLDRLQAGKSANGSGQNGQSGKARQMLDQFGNLIGKQKKLLDDTFKNGRDRRNGDGQGQTGKPGQGQGQEQGHGQGQGQGDSGSGDNGGDQGGLGGLEQRQGDLRNELDKLMQDLNGSGADPNDQLGQAGQSMDTAKGALGNEDPDSAADAQGKAIDQLRKGAQALAEQMMKAQGQQQGNNRNGNGRDPLGRRVGPNGPDDNGLNEGADLNIEGKDVQRSRQIIEELRRRLGESTRPPSELDYLERLLK